MLYRVANESGKPGEESQELEEHSCVIENMSYKVANGSGKSGE